MRKVLVFLFLSMGNSAKLLDQQEYVYLGGETVGIVMGGEVVVNKLFEVNGIKPWHNTFIEEGSVIESVNDTKVSSIGELRSHVVSSNGGTLKINYKTNDVNYVSTIKPQVVHNTYSIGVDAKDKLEGVGTLT